MRPLIFALCLLATPALADVAGVASVIDGDTIEVHGQRIRLHGIDAPESRQLCRLDGKSWMPGTPVELKCLPSRRLPPGSPASFRPGPPMNAYQPVAMLARRTSRR